MRSHRYSDASSGTSVTSPASPTSPVISVNSTSNSSASTPTTGSKSQSRRSSQAQDAERPIPKLANASHRSEELPSIHEQLPKCRNDKLKPKHVIDHIDLVNSECDCSDDETISKFTKVYLKTSPSVEGDIRRTIEPEPGPSGNSSNVVLGADQKPGGTHGDSSNESSFEELGASGTSNGDWLFITKPSSCDQRTDATTNTDCTNVDDSSNVNLTHVTFQNADAHSSQQTVYPSTSIDQHRVRRLVRRRSDGLIYNSSGSKMFTDSMEEGVAAAAVNDMSEDETMRKRTKTSSCDKCGKSKRSLKRHVAKFKRQLETSNASEMEIKKQLEAFLEYLETSHKNSLDGTDTESNEEHRIDDAEATNANDATSPNVTAGVEEVSDFDQLNDDDDNYDFEYDEGIHVYGTDYDETKGTPRQFVDINDYENR